MMVGIAVAAIFLLVGPLTLPTYVVILLTQSLIYAIVAMSLDILIGYTGQVPRLHLFYRRLYNRHFYNALPRLLCWNAFSQ
jgi:ABC-type branched-subunit amino acid transport system permease subunit